MTPTLIAVVGQRPAKPPAKNSRNGAVARAREGGTSRGQAAMQTFEARVERSVSNERLIATLDADGPQWLPAEEG